MTYVYNRLFLSALLTAYFGALLISPASKAGTVLHTSFDSDVLQAPYPMTLYVPDAPPKVDSGYPVVYLLHGSFGSENDWLANGDLENTADRLIASGVIPPTLIVMPGSKSWWLNGHNELAETAFIDDLLPFVEANYPVATVRGGRFIAGLSAGGFGATRLALMHPERFGAAAALSPATYVPLPPKNSSAYRHPAFINAEAAFDAALWQESNYPSYWSDYLAKNITVPFYINSGDHDEFEIAQHATALFSKLRAHQPDAVELRIVDGGHDWQVWAQSLPNVLVFLLNYHQ